MEYKLARIILVVIAYSIGSTMCKSIPKIDVTMTEDNFLDINELSKKQLDIIIREEKNHFSYSLLGVYELFLIAAMKSIDKTQKEFLRVLNLNNNTSFEYFMKIENYYKQYNNDKKYFQMKINNAIIARIGDNDFVKNLNIKLININDKDEFENAEKINTWLKEISNNHSDEIINIRYSKLKLILFNVINLSGEWSLPFNPQLTKLKPFELSNTQIIYHPTMHAKDYFNYSELTDIDIKAKFIQIPYKVMSGKQVFMFIIIPYNYGQFADIEHNIRKLTVKRLFKCSLEKINLYLPKFKIDDTNDLTGTLTQMDIHEAFSDNANFNPITRHINSLSLNHVYQKIYFDVNEYGSNDEIDLNITNERDSIYEEDKNYKEFFVKKQFLVMIANQDIVLITAKVNNLKKLKR